MRKNGSILFLISAFLFILVLISGCISGKTSKVASIKDAMASGVGKEITISGTITRFLPTSSTGYAEEVPDFMAYFGTRDARMYEGTIKDSSGEAIIFIRWELAMFYGENNTLSLNDTTTMTGLVGNIKLRGHDYPFINVTSYQKIEKSNKNKN